MTDYFKEYSFDELNKKANFPEPDIAICSECNGRFKIMDCPLITEGDWETGYWSAPSCPDCEDGGCIDDYTYSVKQLKIYEEWIKENE